MNSYYTVRVRELTSPVAVLGIAAEYIRHNMDVTSNEFFRDGCCRAFGSIRAAANQARDRRSISRKRWDEIYEDIAKAQEHFKNLFKAEGARRTKDYAYWMGTRSNMGQNRRINALLLAAETV